MANWSELPAEVIHLFVRRLAHPEDFVRVTCVCKPWRSVAINENKNMHFCPWLVLTKFSNQDADCNNREQILDCYFPSGKQVFKLQLPQAQGRRCWGTPYCWLVTIGHDLNIHLLNPLTKSQISFPSIPGLQTVPNLQCRSSYNPKFALSSNPSDSDRSLIIMAIYSYTHWFASPGDKSWTRIEFPSLYADLIFFKGRFYCLSAKGMLRICDINKTVPDVENVAYPPHPLKPCRFYLVEISGELHMVCRFYKSTEPDMSHHDTRCFEVFKLNFDTMKWIKVKELDGHAVFIGNNTSFALSTVEYSDLKPDCIYFSDDAATAYQSNYSDMGVYDLKKKLLDQNFFQVHGLSSKFCRGVYCMPSLT